MVEKELPKELLDILACPKCKQDIEYVKKENKLICHNCMLAFKIKDGIPVMLIEKAEKLK